MDPQRWPKILEIFDAATAVSIAQRLGFIEARCKGDRELFDAVHWLLDQDSQAGSGFLKPPPSDPRIEQLLSAEEQANPLLGQRIGDYTIKRLIARGGMGVVYMAEQTNPRRDVALKVMHGGLVSKSALRRFEYESQILAQLHHPNIAQVYEAGVYRLSGQAGQELSYFVLEYIPDARSITQYAGDESLDTRRRLELFSTICDAVQHGHQKGIIHRDLKPANILVDAAGQGKVIDFGVARVTDADIAITTLQSDTGQLIGTLQYMSPEQCAADPHAIDVRSDVYSLGVVLHELLCGKLPYDVSHTPIYHAARIIHEQSPARLSAIDRRLRGDLETIVQKALEKDRDQRYASVAELAHDINRFLNHEPIKARRPTMAYRVRMFARRERGQFVALCAFFLALIGGLVATSVALLHAREAAAEARREKAYAQFQAYAADLYGAESALARYDPSTAGRLLDLAKEKLGQSSGNPEMPWEWRHLSSRLDQSVSILLPKVSDRRRRSIAIDRAGKWMAVALNNEAMLSLYDLKTGKDLECVTSLKNLECIYPLALSPDGHWLAAAWLGGPAAPALGPRPQELGVWEVLQDGLIKRAVAHFSHGVSDVAALAFHPQRCTLAATDVTGVVRLWDLEKQIKTNSSETTLEHSDATWTAHSRQGTGIAFSPDGHLLATGSMDRTVKLWDLSSLDDILMKHELPASVVLLGHTDHVGTVAFSPDGKRLASGSVDQIIRLWDVPGSLQQEKLPKGAHGGICLAVMTGHDGSVNSVAFDESGGRLVSASHDMSIGIWDVRTDAPIADPSKSYEARLPRQQLICRLLGHTNWVNGAAFLGDGQVISCSEDGSVRRWAADTEDVAICREHYSSVYGVAWDPIGSNPRYAASAGADGAIMIWDAALATPMSCIFLRGLESVRGIVCWADKGSALMAVATHRLGRDGLEGRLLIYQILDPARPRRICSLAPGPPGSCAGGYASVAVSQDGSRLAGGTDHGTVQVWDIREPSAPRLLSTLSGGHAKEDFISGVTFLDPQGYSLASVSSSHYPLSHAAGLCIWLIEQKGTTRQLMMDAEGANAVAYDPKRSILAAPTVEHTIRLWEIKRNGEGLRMNRLPQDLSGHVAKVNTLAFHPNEPRLASGSDDRIIKIWDMENLTEVASLRGHLDQIEALAFDRSGQRLASAGQGGLGSDNVVRLWETRRLDSQTQCRRSDIRRAQEELRQIIVDWPILTPEAAKVEMKKATHIPEPVKREAIDRYETLQPHPEWYYVRVQPELKQPGLSGDSYESAKTWIDTAVRMAPENGYYKTAEGILLYRLRRYGQSIAALEQSRQMNNGRFLADDCFLALANWKIGHDDAAEIAYARAEQLNSGSPKQVGDLAISSSAFAEARDQLESKLDRPLRKIKPAQSTEDRSP